MSLATPIRRITIRDLNEATARGEKWAMITAYDALTARIFDEAGIPCLLVGDSAAQVVYGFDSTLPVTVDDLVPLVAGVVRGSSRALVVADMPFGSYETGPEEALHTAFRFMKETGAHAVKLEGGARVLPQVELLASAGIPVIETWDLAQRRTPLQIGFSHPVVMDMPAGVKVECPTQTEILIKGADRQAVGQVAAEVRAIRPPEPYKGKGIRYADERVVIKETKKK